MVVNGQFLPGQSKSFCKIDRKNRNFRKFAQKNRNCFARIDDPQISNQIYAAALFKRISLNISYSRLTSSLCVRSRFHSHLLAWFPLLFFLSHGIRFPLASSSLSSACRGVQNACCMMRIMHHGQNRGKQKRKLSQSQSSEKREIYKFCGNRGQ